MNSSVNKTQMARLPKIAAIDFDGTLVCDAYPVIGKKNEAIFLYVKQLKSIGYKLILWSCRDGKALDDAVAYCATQGLTFDAINDNIEEVKTLFNNNTRKVYADVYLDDKNIFSEEVHPCR